MKKIALILAALMLLTFAAIPASASGGARFYLTGDTSAKVGDTVKVTLHIDGEFAAHIINLSVFFDNTSLRYVGKKNKDAYNAAIGVGGYPLSSINPDGNAIAVGLMMLTDPATEPGEFIEFTFEVLSTASPEASFTILVDQFGYMPVGAVNSEPIPYTAEPFSIHITGSTGTGTTPAPTSRPEATPKPTATPKPINTPGPANTPKPGETTGPANTDDNNTRRTEGTEPTPAPGETAGPGESADPGATEDPNSTAGPTENLPETSGEPGNAEFSEAPDNAKETSTESRHDTGTASERALKTGLIAGGSLLLLALCALVVILIAKKKKA